MPSANRMSTPWRSTSPRSKVATPSWAATPLPSSRSCKTSTQRRTASVYLFGAEPGKLPAQLYDVLARTTDEADRAQLGAALARCWAYAGQPTRGAQFADQAVERAERVGAPELLADCLDAALAAHWGPDELDVRRSMAARLDDVTAHVLDPETRLQAHLWSLQIACETLDLQGAHRQMRALELLGGSRLAHSSSRRPDG